MINRDSSPVLFDYPNPGSNVFLMMRFGDTKQHLAILRELRAALEFYGFHGLRADDKISSDSLWSNVKSYMDACDSGIAVFEQIETEGNCTVLPPSNVGDPCVTGVYGAA